jgi:hypothetical protein
MNREEYLRELETAGNELQSKVRELAVAANPLNQLRSEVARDWKWWLPGASVAGFAVARFLRMPAAGRAAKRGGTGEAAASGAAFWVPVVLKLLPATLTQLVPLFLSLRSGRKN